MLYEGGIRVPWIARWTGRIKPGQTTDEPILSVDLYPTLLDVAGVKPTPGYTLDGVSLGPALMGDNRTKLDRKVHLRYSGFMGGQKRTALKTLMSAHPDRVVHEAVWGMMPKNKLSRHQLTHLRVYAGPEHPHAAQQPRRDDAF